MEHNPSTGEATMAPLEAVEEEFSRETYSQTYRDMKKRVEQAEEHLERLRSTIRRIYLESSQIELPESFRMMLQRAVEDENRLYL